MGQKVNPHGFRVGVIKDWDSRWYARDNQVGDLLVEDKKIREFLKKTLYSAGVPKIEIERSNEKVRCLSTAPAPAWWSAPTSPRARSRTSRPLWPR